MPENFSVFDSVAVAALIGGLISLLGLLLSKEQKISEFRQAWVDGLRDDIASLIAHAYFIHDSENHGVRNGPDGFKNIGEHFLAANTAMSRIRLRLNPEEPESIEIEEQIDKLEELIGSDELRKGTHLQDLENALIGKSRVLLKKEWNRVRDGERIFRSLKIGFVITVAVAVLWIVF